VARVIHRFDPPERFVAGTVGEPGQRTFYLQARAGNRLCTVVVEKEQVRLLGERLGGLLDEVARRTGSSGELPGGASADDTAPLDVPIEEEFRVGTLTLGWDASAGRVVVEAIAVGPEPEEVSGGEPAAEDDLRDVLQVRITAGDARAFVRRALALVAAGRPPCPLCGQPLDPSGHVCPRQNGYRRRA
jgi:uncharacterized repeat protein (TIGR03847 family)